MDLLVKTFPRGGGHIPHRKSATEQKAIVTMPAPKTAVIPLQQHIGAPCEPIVKVGDYVKIGQKIGEAQAYVSAPVHASVSGKVVDIKKMPLMDGTNVNCVVIDNDGLDQFDKLQAKDLNKLSDKDIGAIIRDAGIVGMGGAGFPTHVKVAPTKPVDTVIINGAECEPYLTCDHRLMVEQPEQVVYGLRAIMKACGASSGVIGVEMNKPDALESLTQACAGYSDIRVIGLKVKYPQGAEKQLIKAVTGREVPSGCLPAEVGCIVSNVHTAIAVSEAITKGVALYQRVVTVAGAGVYDPRNVLVRIGTPVQELIDFCGGMNNPEVVVAGGPMTGKIVTNLSGPVVKNTSGILLLSKDEYTPESNAPCIRCARCVDHCPAGLLPNFLAVCSNNGQIAQAVKLNIMDCIECGLCSFVCPAHRGVSRAIKAGKEAVRAQKSAISGGEQNGQKTDYTQSAD